MVDSCRNCPICFGILCSPPYFDPVRTDLKSNIFCFTSPKHRIFGEVFFMKKNYFYTTMQEEFSLLLSAVRAASKEEMETAQKTCFSRHKGLCLHLLRDFITPIQREDLYEISSAIFSVFPTVVSLSSAERILAEQSVLLLSSDPFRFDETSLRRRETLWEIWEERSSLSSGGRECFFALDRLAEKLFVAAVKNV